MISSVIFIVAACAVAVRCWLLVVVLFGTGTGTGTPHCAQSRHGAGMLALACRTTLALDSTGLVFGALSRRHVVTFITTSPGVHYQHHALNTLEVRRIQ
jgi:hypothetical protein